MKLLLDENLSSNERALLAHCLISSPETVHDNGVDEAWAQLSEKRFSELESGAVSSVSWDDIKKGIRG